MGLAASEFAKLPGVETREYRPGELLPAERLKQRYSWVREGAIGLHVPAGRAAHAMLEVFGPGWLVSPAVFETPPAREARRAAALLQTTTLELPADAFNRQVAAQPSLAVALASWNAHQYASSLDRLAMVALRDPVRRMPAALLLLLGRLGGAPGPASSARLDVGQQLIAAFANLSRQTTNKQLRRLARAGLVGLERGVVHVRNPGALRDLASGRALGR